MKSSFKNIFLTGLAVLLPIGLTFYVLTFLIEMMDSLLLIMPAGYHPDAFLPFHVPGLGVAIMIIFIFLCGLITKSYIGNKTVELGEKILDKIPVVRSIYQAIKQVSDSMFADKNRSFKKVVLIRFPREDIYSVAFVTGTPNGEFKDKIKIGNRNYVSVFMPTAPNPTTGLYMIMPEDELIFLDMGIEEAFTVVVSAGIVMPHERLPYKRGGTQENLDPK